LRSLATGHAVAKAGEYVAALDWYQLLYAYDLPLDKRKIFHGLIAEENLSLDYKRPDHWTLNQINPHSVAARRANTYSRFTIMTIARCFWNLRIQNLHGTPAIPWHGRCNCTSMHAISWPFPKSTRRRRLKA